MLFYSFFKTLLNTQVTIQLKNDVEVTGTLISVDQFLNIKLESLTMAPNSYLVSIINKADLKNCFIRGSVIRYVFLDSSKVDVPLLQDAARIEHSKK